MSQRHIRLGDGRVVRLGAYVAAWRKCLTLPPSLHIGPGIDGLGQTAAEALCDLRYGLHDRINRHVPGFGAGRKWSNDWQRHAASLARDVNTPRLIVRAQAHPIAAEFPGRLDHRVIPRGADVE